MYSGCLLQSFISSSQKGGKHATGHRSQCLKSIHRNSTHWCVQRDIVLVAHHVPGKSNSLADRESRVFVDNSDWMLDPSLIRPLLSDCKTDLFASRLTRQYSELHVDLPGYVSSSVLAGDELPPDLLVTLLTKCL